MSVVASSDRDVLFDDGPEGSRMPLDIGLWRLDDGIQRLLPTGLPSENRLEGLIETDPSVLGPEPVA